MTEEAGPHRTCQLEAKPSRIDHHQPRTDCYKALHNENDNTELFPEEQLSTSTPPPQTMQSDPLVLGPETDSSETILK